MISKCRKVDSWKYQSSQFWQLVKEYREGCVVFKYFIAFQMSKFVEAMDAFVRLVVLTVFTTGALQFTGVVKSPGYSVTAYPQVNIIRTGTRTVSFFRYDAKPNQAKWLPVLYLNIDFRISLTHFPNERYFFLNYILNETWRAVFIMMFFFGTEQHAYKI